MTQSLHTCEVCKSNDVVPVLDLGKHPLCDDLIHIGSPHVCDEFSIEIVLCRSCGTAHQLHGIPKRRLFPQSYHYRSSLTEDVIKGMQGLVTSIEIGYGSLKDKLVLDVGCNDGSLLKCFLTAGARVRGIEPTGAATDAQAAGLDVTQEFFDPDSARRFVERNGHPDYITFTNVFAHIENMDELVEAVTIAMGDNTRLVVENHYLGSVLERYQFDTFYHEHPRTYSLSSFVAIAKRLGRKLEQYSFPSRYGGNIRVVIGPGPASAPIEPRLIADEAMFYAKFESLRAIIAKWADGRELLLNRARCVDGKVYAKAFPGRAAILIKMLKLDVAEVAIVFEKPGSKKIDHYVPGTRIPIQSDELLLATIPGPRRILNLAWHIAPEIREYLRRLDPHIEVVDVFPPAEFETHLK